MARDRRRVDDEHVDALARELDRDARGELRHVRLGRAVAHGERVGDVRGRRRREHDAAAQALLEHERREVVRDARRRGRVALDVDEQLARGLRVEEAGDDEAGVVEDELHVDVARRESEY